MKKIILVLLLIAAGIWAIIYFHLIALVIGIFFMLVALVFFIGQYVSVMKSRNWKYAVNNVLLSGDYSGFLNVTLPANLKTSLFQRVKGHIIRILWMISTSLCWPIMTILYAIKPKKGDNRRMTNIAEFKLNPLQLHITLFYVLAVIILAASYYFNLADLWIIRFFAIAFTVAIACFLLCMLIGPEDLASIFKGSPGNIFAGVILVCLGVTVSLFILFSIIVSLYKFGHFNIAATDTVINELFKQDTVGLIWKRKFADIQTLNLLISLSGLLFAATILDTVKNIKSFRRDTKDMQKIASNYLHIGEYNKVLEWLQKMGKSNWDEISRMYNIIALGALGQKQKAMDLLHHTHYESTDTDYATDHKFYETISLTMNFQTRSFTEMLVAEWIDACKCEGLLFQTLFNMFFIGQNFPIEKTLAVYSKSPDHITNLPLSYQLLVFGSKENPDFDELCRLLDAEIAKDSINALSKSLVENWMIASCLGMDVDIDIVRERLNRLQVHAAQISKGRDLLVLVMAMRGIMSILPKNHQAYQQLLFIHNELKSKITPGDNTKLLGQFELAG